ncbi:ATP-dependent RNA helicase DDX1 [Portunus trituberculatus]|uniref:ATP-dependent RNA helicase n=1 Tax=Portunus trituberculatus TaxID=210409 RepID=A0A5B7DHC0_PORTR|nr:ATP-dependent RNA helicase DDX1 [Portunus trituberculatus]
MVEGCGRCRMVGMGVGSAGWWAWAWVVLDEMGVMPEIAKAVEEMDWTLPTDVQNEAIPLILGGGDVLMAAETGSGKTGAFCLPILQIVWESLKDIQQGKTSKVTKEVDHSKLQEKGKLILRVEKEKEKETCKKAISLTNFLTFPEAPLWLMSFFDRDAGLAVTPDGLRCQSRDPKAWQGVRCTKGVTGKGKYFFEALVSDEGLCRVGWSTPQAALDLGTCKNGFGFGGTGKKSNCKQFDEYGECFGLNDTLGCHLDLDSMEISYSKNGVDLGKAFTLRSEFKNAVFHPAVVLKPSRELAEQTLKQVQLFRKHLENPLVRDLLVVGGIPVKDQIAALNKGVDIVCGTPGRLEELINTGQLSLQSCKFFVLDEADGLLKQGHEKLINNIYNSIPKITSDGKRLQMVVCSATLHSFEVKRMAERLMHFPTWVDLKGEDSVPETVHHVVVRVDPRTDNSWTSLRRHVQTDGVHAKDGVRPGNNTPGGGAHNRGNPYSCVCLHGDRKPGERKANLQSFKDGNVKFLICTDVAARGIDVSGLPFIINVTLPDEKSNYVHRIGRVGRAERMGLAISLVSAVPEKVWYHGEWCPSRGRNCYNTRLTTERGCCTWYNEPQYLADIEEHLGVTIQQVDKDMKVPVDEFDGKVVYGEKKGHTGSNYQTHVEQLAPAVSELAKLEKETQNVYLKRQYGKVYPWTRCLEKKVLMFLADERFAWSESKTKIIEAVKRMTVVETAVLSPVRERQVRGYVEVGSELLKQMGGKEHLL